MTGGAYYEFFAGGGMARAGLGAGWRCLLANDLDPAKAESYRRNWGGDEFLLADVASLTPADIPPGGDLAWASFPCQDLSLAGAGAGLGGARSGTFWPFWRLMNELGEEGRAPSIVVLENVPGALTSHGGADFAAIMEALAQSGYAAGALIIDAAHFLPQSRPRLFIIGAKGEIPAGLRAPGPDEVWSPARLAAAQAGLDGAARRAWVWWRLPAPPARNASLIDLLEAVPDSAWRAPEETRKLLSMMSPANRAKVEEARRAGRPMAGAVFRRTRADASGRRAQRAEIRFDGLAGCLRTPGGGSSRQIVMLVNGNDIRSRLLTPRETARLMGLPDDYILPENRNAAYHLTGDGLAVPAVRWLARNLLDPLLIHQRGRKRKAA